MKKSPILLAALLTLAVILLSVGFEKLILAATRWLGRSFGGE